jgi:CelD/BcsL family acetyltransferase involved in cellulose biosynthesis
VHVITPELVTGEATAELRRSPSPSRAPSLLAIDGGGCRVRVARTVEEVAALRPEWAALLGDSVNTDIDYYLWSLREPQVVRPHVLVVERQGVVEGIVVARIVHATLPCKLGHATVYSPTVRAVCVVREGWLGRADAYSAEVIMDELMAALDRREGDVVLFRQLEHDSVLHRAALARSTFATRRQHVARTNVRWVAELKPTLDEYLATVSLSTRKGVRRTSSRLERLYGDRLSIDVFGGGDLDAFLAEVEAVASRTYQRRIGVGYLGNQRQLERMRLLAERGWFRGYILRLDGRPVAFELGELYGCRFRSIAGAYDPEYGHERVGAYLLLKVFEGLGADVDATVFDFGFGDADYKAKLSQRRFEEGDFVVYARRPRPIWIKLARTAMLELTTAVTRGLARLALLERLKRRRRSEAAAAA